MAVLMAAAVLTIACRIPNLTMIQAAFSFSWLRGTLERGLMNPQMEPFLARFLRFSLSFSGKASVMGREPLDLPVSL
eukprot:scaffold276027_cov14-Tisochrysis_lutea.AAC.1